jgi:radical SAM superfamily enzyme YgiQ (UPF0313 family)
MQIVLATSPHVRHVAVLQAGFAPNPSVMYTFAPVGLLSLASMLRQSHRIEPVLFDTNQHIINGSIPLRANFYEEAAERICAHRPDVLGFMTECDSYHHVLQMMEHVKRLRPECRCVLGGPHASAVAFQTMSRRTFVDAVVIGEGELTLPELISKYRNSSAEPVTGAITRDPNGGIVMGPKRQLQPELDRLPAPAYDLYAGTPGEEIFVEAGRGCPFQCTFCSTAPFWERRHRVKSPERLLEEIREVQRLYNSERVHFTHDLLTTDKRWVSELCRTLTAAGSPVKWTCSARTDTVDPGLLSQMAAAGCNAIYFGIESGSARVLHDIQKSVPIERSLEVLQECRRTGIRPNAGYIAGFPTEDRQSLEDTFTAFAKSLRIGARPAHIFGFCPFADSTMYKGLQVLECDGHYLDLPITPEIDHANRKLVASDRDLFGAYFRPKLNLLPSRIKGVDEFSNLVEPVAIPALRLADSLGGMLPVFDRWTTWIEHRNRVAGHPEHRRFYGSPLEFCEFVVAELSAISPADHPVLQLAELTRTSLSLADQWAVATPTTMANHRSLAMPAVGAPLSLSDRVQIQGVLAVRRFDYDLTPFIDATPEQSIEPLRETTYLMWDLAEDGRIQLSKIDPFLYMSLEQLKDGPKPVASLMINWADSGEPLDYSRLMHVLTEAQNRKLVETL